MKNYVNSAALSIPHLKGLHMAQQPDNKVFDIDVLVGADYYWSVVGDEMVKGTGPAAVSSKLGYLPWRPKKKVQK